MALTAGIGEQWDEVVDDPAAHAQGSIWHWRRASKSVSSGRNVKMAVCKVVVPGDEGRGGETVGEVDVMEAKTHRQAKGPRAVLARARGTEDDVAGVGAMRYLSEPEWPKRKLKYRIPLHSISTDFYM